VRERESERERERERERDTPGEGIDLRCGGSIASSVPFGVLLLALC
jgi:hypothetical protein